MPLKVLNLTSTPSRIGGVESLLLSGVGKYDSSRFSVAYCNLFGEDGSVFPQSLRGRGATYFHVPGETWGDLPRMVTRLVQLIRRERFDVLHSHMLHATIVGHVAARIARVPVRIASRQYTGEVFYNKPTWVRRLDRHLTRTATHVTACSESVRETLIREDQIPPSKITAVHNSIDLQALDALESDRAVPWDASWGEDILLGCIGSLTPRKGHADLFHALAQVLARRPGVRLVVLGEGPERENLEALAAQLGIADHVLLAGFREDTQSLVRKFDLYVHPSRQEPFGIAITEAMAARRPIVACAVGGIPEVVGDAAGLLVPPMEPDAMAAAILRLIENPRLSRELGECGRRRVELCFSVQETINAYQKLYTRFTKTRRTGRSEKAGFDPGEQPSPVEGWLPRGH